MSKGDYGEPYAWDGHSLFSASRDVRTPIAVPSVTIGYDPGERIAACLNALDGIEDPAAFVAEAKEAKRRAGLLNVFLKDLEARVNRIEAMFPSAAAKPEGPADE